MSQPFDGLGDGLCLHLVQSAAEVLQRLDHALHGLILGVLDTKVNRGVRVTSLMVTAKMASGAVGLPRSAGRG